MKKHDINFLKSLGIIKKDCLIDYTTIDYKTAVKLTSILSKFYLRELHDLEHAYDILESFVNSQLERYENINKDDEEWEWEYLDEDDEDKITH